MAGETKKLQITWFKSAIGYSQRQKDTIRALGLRKLNQTIEKEDNAVTRGMTAEMPWLKK